MEAGLRGVEGVVDRRLDVGRRKGNTNISRMGEELGKVKLVFLGGRKFFICIMLKEYLFPLLFSFQWI